MNVECWKFSHCTPLAWALVLSAMVLSANSIRVWGADGTPRAAADGIALDNDLPVAGARVVLQLPWGNHYHPGTALLLQGHVHSVAAGVDGSLALQEGNPDWGPRSEAPLHLQDRQAATFRIPFRAPKSGATLALSVWKNAGAGSRQEIFRNSPTAPVSLASVLRVVPADQRIVLQLGSALFQASFAPPGWHVTRISGEQLPEADWMYENLDLVVLDANAFQACPAEAKAALRRWLLGGGRLLVLSRDALREAVLAGLLPLPGTHKDLSDQALCEAAGVVEEEVQRDERGSRVFARFQLGLGGGLFFFTAVDPAALVKFGSSALTSPALIYERSERPDLRIWEQPFPCFVPGSIAGERNRKAALFAAVGAAGLLALLLFARKERNRYVAGGIPLAGTLLLATLLVRGFPMPEWVVSRVEVAEIPADGRVRKRTEWAYVESLRDDTKLDASTLVVQGPEQGTLMAVHKDESELEEAGADLEADGALRLRFRPLDRLALPPLFYAARCETQDSSQSAPGGPEDRLYAASTGVQVRLPPGAWLARAKRAFGKAPRGALLVGRDGRSERLEALWAAGDGGFQRLPCERSLDAVKAALPELSGPESAARAAALEMALKQGERRGRARLVLFDTPLEGTRDEEDLIRIEGAPCERGPRFLIWVLEAAVTEER